MGEDFNFEDYRQPWETGPQWDLKREFMEKYNDMFSEDRLLCLAQAYSNIVLLNCRYPDPVMIQINNLAKPLQMRKKFQGNPEIEEESSNQNPTKKVKTIHQKFGRPFKEIKFCTSTEKIEELLFHHTVQENSPSSQYLMPEDLPASALNKQTTETLKEVKALGFSKEKAKEHSETKVNSTSSFGNLKPVLYEKTAAFSQNDSYVNETSKIITDNLGMEFIQNLVKKIRAFQTKNMSPLQCIISAGNALKINDFIDFQFEIVDKAKSKDQVKFCCKLILKNCYIASGTGTSKQKAKLACSMCGVDKLLNLVEITNINNIRNEILNKHNHLNLPEKDYNNLQKLRELIGNQKLVISSLRNAISVLNLGDIITIKRTLSEVYDSNNKLQKLNTWQFLYENILIASGCETKLKAAKQKGLQSAYNKLINLSKCKIQNNELIFQEESSGFSSESMPIVFEYDSSSNISDKSINLCKKYAFDLNKGLFNSSVKDCFALIYADGKNIRNVLPHSASLCRKSFTYNVVDMLGETYHFKASVLIDNVTIASGFGISKDYAKLDACVKAIELLRKKYYVIWVKENHSLNFKITREQVFSNTISANETLKDSNIGCKMMKSMGWTGGGLGHSGIVEPIGIDSTPNYGRGLGFSKEDSDTKTLKTKIHSLLKDFTQSNSMSDLIFAKSFSKDERKSIHRIAGKYNLQSTSSGKGNDRFLVVKRKYSIVELLTYLESIGGSDDKYQLLDASRDENNPFEIK